MLSCIRNNNVLIVVLNDNSLVQTNSCDDEMYEKVVNATNDDDVLLAIFPVAKAEMEEAFENKNLLLGVKESSLLTRKDDSVYWEEVSSLSMPKELVRRILEAENNNDADALESYKNFWTLLSLNPDPLCRENLFKFLKKWGMVISKAGLFVGYRNVKVYDVGATPETTVYTDVHSGTTRIKIGQMVTMPRELCDCDSHRECSRGLHLSYIGWLKNGYFGNVGLTCLCNPADVVAVPFDDESYGKLRTCAYLPVAITKYDENNDVIPTYEKDGFIPPYVKTILYDGVRSTELNPTYIMDTHTMSIDMAESQEKVLAIAAKYMKEYGREY